MYIYIYMHIHIYIYIYIIVARGAASAVPTGPQRAAPEDSMSASATPENVYIEMCKYV